MTDYTIDNDVYIYIFEQPVQTRRRKQGYALLLRTPQYGKMCLCTEKLKYGSSARKRCFRKAFPYISKVLCNYNGWILKRENEFNSMYQYLVTRSISNVCNVTRTLDPGPKHQEILLMFYKYEPQANICYS